MGRGQSCFYTFVNDILDSLMSLDKQLKQRINNVLRRHLKNSPYKAFYFGSRVRGDNFERADIDIGIEGTMQLPVRTKFAIEDELETLPTLLRFDVVDFYGTTQSFQKQAAKSTELIYDKRHI